uniref:Serine/threonine protein kinase n=1 Tax=Meloidogyne hapla TaxID=6305 RepID=A0A1I8BL45_MELHA
IYHGKIKSTTILTNYGKKVTNVVVKINKKQETKEDKMQMANEIKILESFNKLPKNRRKGIIELIL